MEDVLREAEAAGLAEEDEPLGQGEVMGEDEAMEASNDGTETQLDETAPEAASEVRMELAVSMLLLLTVFRALRL